MQIIQSNTQILSNPPLIHIFHLFINFLFLFLILVSGLIIIHPSAIYTHWLSTLPVHCKSTGMAHHYSAHTISIPLARQLFAFFFFLLQPTRNTLILQIHSGIHFFHGWYWRGNWRKEHLRLPYPLSCCFSVGPDKFLTCGTFPHPFFVLNFDSDDAPSPQRLRSRQITNIIVANCCN